MQFPEYALIIVIIIIIIIVLYLVLKHYKKIDWYSSDTVVRSGNWVLSWSDDFESLDLNKWIPFVGGDPTKGCGKYASENVNVQNSNLVINIRPSPDGLGYLTGRVSSARKFGPYGFYASKLMIDGNSRMLWPSFWLVNTDNWPYTGEIDIMETVNATGTNLSTVHCAVDQINGYQGLSYSNHTHVDFSQWTVFGCLWSPEEISLYIFPYASGDINDYHPNMPNFDKYKIAGSLTKDRWFGPCTQGGYKDPFTNNAMNIIFNMAIGGQYAGAGTKCMCDPAGTTCGGYTNCTNANCVGLNINAKYLVDWVSVWEVAE